MPTAERAGTSLYYETAGDGETVAFVGDLGYGAWQWGWQHRAVAGPHESLVWDLRGTGRSDAPPGPYAMADLAADLEAVLAAAGARRAHLVGLGLGGLVALEYALSFDRARSLVLVGTAADPEWIPDDPVDRLQAPRDDPTALRETLAPVLGEAFRQRQPEVVDGIVRWRAGGEASADGADNAVTGDGTDGRPTETTAGPGRGGGDADEAGWRAQAAALAGWDGCDRLHEVSLPALVVHGTADAVWPPAGGERLAENLPHGQYVSVQGGPHLVTVERSRTVNDRLLAALEGAIDG